MAAITFERETRVPSGPTIVKDGPSDASTVANASSVAGQVPPNQLSKKACRFTTSRMASSARVVSGALNRSGPVQVVMHDAPVTPLPVPLEGEGVALRPGSPRQNAAEKLAILVVEREPEHAEIVLEVFRIASAHDGSCDLGSIQHPAGRNRRQAHLVLVADPLAGGQELLEQVPAAEIVDDQLVFRQRAIGERPLRLGSAEPAPREEAARNRAITEKAHVLRPAQVREGKLRAGIEQRILHLHRDQRYSCLDKRFGVGRIEVRAADLIDLAFRLELAQDESRLDRAGDLVVPPVKLHEVEPVGPQTLQGSVDNPPHV